MKNYLSIFAFVAVAATTLISCSREIDKPEAIDSSVKMKTITVKTVINTKTTLDSNHENIVWTEGDKISIFNDADNSNSEADYVAGGDITVTVPAATTEIYAHYPYYSGNTNGPTAASVYIANNQTQANPGELNGYYFPMVAKGTVSDDKAIISLYPVASALALNIYHTGLSGEETVKSVKVTPSNNTNFIGRQTTDITADNITYSSAELSKPVVVTLTNALALEATKPSNSKTFDGQIYVCLAKQSYSGVKFEIETDKGLYTITSNSTAFDLENNDFIPVNINLAKAAFEEFDAEVDPTGYSWTLVKDALVVGDKVIIAAAESNFALSTTQNNNNRGQIAITKSGNHLTANENVQVFKVVTGSENNSIALKCLNGDQIRKCIAAASSSNNYMHSNAEIDANASWSVAINTTSGVASVVAQGSNTNNVIQYNSTSGLFSCYGSASQAAIIFYRAGLPYANISFPEASYSVNLGDAFTAPNLSNPDNLSVTYSSSNTDVATVNASTGDVTILAAGTATISATFDGNSSYSATTASYEITVVDTSAEQWVKTAITDITASDVFVIVGGGYAVTNDNGTTSAPAAVSVSIANDALSDIPDDNLRWKLTGSASAGYSFSPTNDNAKFLYCNTTASSSSNNNIRVGTGDRKVWEFTSSGIMKTKDSNTVRYFSKYNNQDWRGYTGTSNGAVALDFYVKKGGSSKTLSSISVTPPTKTTYNVGDAFDATGMVVTATYSDATTADVTSSATTDFASQVASAGSKTVTVSYTEGDITETDTFNITVNASGGAATVTFDFSSISETTTGGWNGAHTISPITITATSANTNKAGQVRFQAGGTITFTGATITRIEIINSGNYTGNLSASVGNYSVSGNNGIWTGSSNNIVLTNNGNSGTRTISIVVTYID